MSGYAEKKLTKKELKHKITALELEAKGYDWIKKELV